jgi:hypothetical protein
MLVRMQRKKNPYTLLVRMQISATVMGISMEIPQKTKNRPAIHFSNITLGICPQECYKHKRIQQDTIEPLAHPCLL